MMERAAVVELMRAILARQGKDPGAMPEDVLLSDLAFRSLDFSELCLRVEQRLGRELDFTAATVRSVTTVGDVCDFIAQAARNTTDG